MTADIVPTAMSDQTVKPKRRDHHSRDVRGQSMVEFALVFPMLLVLLLGVADFGRVFAAGITVEAAARNAAEAVAQEYLRNPPAPMELPAPPGNDAYYENLHALAARTACREVRTLPETTYTADNTVTPGDEEACSSMPIIRTCIHDEADTRCGQIAFGASPPAGKCEELEAPISPDMEGGAEESRYVEVRICYRFTTIVNLTNVELPFGWGISVGEIHLEKDRTFTVGFYPPPPTPVPPPQPSAPPPTEAPSEEPSPSESPVESPSTSASPVESPSEPPADTPTPAPTPSETPTEPPSESPQP